MKKIISIIVCVLAFNSSAHAEDMQVGTGALAFIAGINNIYLQLPVADTAAVTIEYASVDDLEVFGDTISATSLAFTYKTYMGQYGKSNFWKFGAADFSVTSGTSSAEGLSPIILYGLESTNSDNLVYGYEVGFGTTAGFGLFNLYVGYGF